MITLIMKKPFQVVEWAICPLFTWESTSSLVSTKPKATFDGSQASIQLFFFTFFVVLGRGTLWHLQSFLQCIKYSILEIIPSTDLPFLLSIA
jgi:hypothetical protein